ncbi:MAG: 4Fe-4S dicluster domain-containing protein, partial [Candidatus Methanofastidiosia archaeon]
MRIRVFKEKCTGCMQCSLACSLTKFGECNPKKSAIYVHRDEFEREEFPQVCRQCKKPFCVEACELDAFFETENVWQVNFEKCNLCRACLEACPFNAIFEFEMLILKCDLCGGEPQCVKYCATKAIVFKKGALGHNSC